MASINNLNQIAQNAHDKSVVMDSMKEGIKEFTVDEMKVFTSTVRDINLNFVKGVHALLRGKKDLDVVGNDKDNLIVGNDGNNQIDAGDGNDQLATGKGDDEIWLGAGDDVIEIDGTGNKVVDGGEGNDLFVITKDALGEDTHVTLTGLSRGDTLRVFADVNSDGKITWDDIESVGPDANGNTTFELKDGTKFTLEGVAGEEGITYTISEDGEGNLYVELS